MQKSAAIKSLQSVIGKLSNLNYHIDGNQLQTAIREVASVISKLETKQLKMKS